MNITQMLDMSEQLKSGLHRIQGVPMGMPSKIYAVGLGIVAVGMGLLAWHFDYAATIIYSTPIINNIVAGLPTGYGQYIAFIAFILTILPTAIEMFVPRAATGTFAGLLFYGCLLFDMATDAPRVWQTLAFFPELDGMAYAIAYAVLLLFSSIGFEIMFVVASVCGLFLALREMRA